MSRQLSLIDELLAQGRQVFTFHVAQEMLSISASATANVLHSLSEKGLVDRLSRGHYAIRPLGSLGTSAVTDNLAGSVAAIFAGVDHRVGYLSALGELSLVMHPVRTVQVACIRQVRIPTVGKRPLQTIIERPQTIHLETDGVGGSWMSNLHRAVFESALRVDLVGGSQVLCEALGNGCRDLDLDAIQRLVWAFGARGRAAERRLASIAGALGLPVQLAPVMGPRQPLIRLDPKDDHQEWIDRRFRVAWNISPDEAWGVVGS